MSSLYEYLLFVVALTLSIFGVQADIASPANSSEREPEVVYAQVIKVSDGDTITVEFPDRTTERVRYIGIDTPELGRDGKTDECYAQAATERNAELVLDQTVRLESDVEDRDRYDRLLRYVYSGDQFVNEILVAEGYATAIKIKPNVAHYDSLQKHAQTARIDQLGMWNACI